jgi:ribosome-binding protein aMBF1 (putative translation factor)
MKCQICGKSKGRLGYIVRNGNKLDMCGDCIQIAAQQKLLKGKEIEALKEIVAKGTEDLGYFGEMPEIKHSKIF